MDGWETTFRDAAYFHVLLLLVSGRVQPTTQLSSRFCWEISLSLPKKNLTESRGIPNYLLHPRGRYFLFILNSSGFDFQVSPGIFSPDYKGCIIAGLRLKENPISFHKPSDHNKAASYFWGGGVFFRGRGLVDQWWDLEPQQIYPSTKMQWSKPTRTWHSMSHPGWLIGIFISWLYWNNPKESPI